ncbi:HAD family hydrolase [Bacillus cereus]|uniref:HAD family hydrolase n=1 Tax=Bacillus cereus TaxID=1396 RepID=UPI000BF816AA|nr:HAD family hydrolase [Bacillus cereus]PEQ47114.1 hypothetical protein CN469_31490 [Bacillus cereus]
MTKLITFDLDGTLVDSATSIAKCINYILKLEGKETVNLEILTSMVGVGTEKMFESFNIICSKESYQNIYSQNFLSDITIFEDAVSAIQMAKTLGYKVAIVTNRDEQLAYKIASKLGLYVIVDGVFGVSKNIRPKPFTDLFSIAQENIGAQIVAHIGDHSVDIESAYKFNVQPAVIYRQTKPYNKQRNELVGNNLEKLIWHLKNY